MTHQIASDASFYALVHHVLEAQQGTETMTERRENERHVFTSLHFVAPYRDRSLPSESEFQQVLCKDLSPSGLSYVAAEPPTTENVVVAMGAEAPIFFAATVVRHRPLLLADRALTLVAVRFMARLQTPDYGRLTADPPPYASECLSPLGESRPS
jgi:hypothetical protein